MDETTRKAYVRLASIRKRTDLKLRKLEFLRDKVEGIDGTERDLFVRYYQVVGTLHLVTMLRFVLGDDCGLGKSLTAILGLCYLWEKEPDRKAIVVTNKSPIGQWCGEFRKFCREGSITIVRCEGTPKQRERAYEEFQNATGPTVMVMGYATVRVDFSKLQGWKEHFLVFDECFHYHVPIVLADGSTELIGKIVSQKQKVEVLSVNLETGEIEPRKVVNWFRKPTPGFSKQPWLSKKEMLWIAFRFSGNVQVTKSHDFYSHTGEKIPAQDLRKGSSTRHLTNNYPSPIQWQIVLGSLLGDGCISSPSHDSWGFSFGHCDAQKELLLWKHRMLSPLGASQPSLDVNGGYPKKDGSSKFYWRFRMQANAALTSFLVKSEVRRKGKKRVTPDWLDRIDTLGLAVWYADDGSLSSHTTKEGVVRHTITFSSHDFSREENGLLAGWLRWRWGVQAQVKTTRKRSDRDKGVVKTFPYLYLNAEASRKFLSLMPGAIPGVEYKFPGLATLDVPQDRLQPSLQWIEDWVKQVRPWKPPQNHHYVYDIEVEGNHNYFANHTLVSNCQAFKNPKSQVHQCCKHLASNAARVWGLTATLIKNNLSEGYGIYQVLLAGTDIQIFPGSLTAFLNEYYVMRLQKIGKGNRQVPIPVYPKKGSVEKFRQLIDPFYLGRPKHEVAKELPPLTIRVEKTGMTKAQEQKYEEALAGLLEIDTTGEVKETTQLTALIYCQQIVDHPELVGCEGDSKKLDRLLELLSTGDYAEENVIVYTRFRKMVDLLMPVLKKAKIPATRVTGAEVKKVKYKGQDVTERDVAMAKFQDPKDPTRVICITDAASESINLQSAKLLIFYDSPYSGGNFLQILGRMIRIGSLHDRVYALHLAAEGTIDEKVLGILKRKMNLIEAVMGKRIKGEKDEVQVDSRNDISELFKAMQDDARKKLKGRTCHV